MLARDAGFPGDTAPNWWRLRRRPRAPLGLARAQPAKPNRHKLLQALRTPGHMLIACILYSSPGEARWNRCGAAACVHFGPQSRALGVPVPSTRDDGSGGSLIRSGVSRSARTSPPRPGGVAHPMLMAKPKDKIRTRAFRPASCSPFLFVWLDSGETASFSALCYSASEFNAHLGEISYTAERRT
jgi:hypothetical protein